MALALNNLKRVDMPLNKETKPNHPNAKNSKTGKNIQGNQIVPHITKNNFKTLDSD